MIEQFLTWMSQPGTYNDLVVFLGLFVIAMILAMIFCKDR